MGCNPSAMNKGDNQNGRPAFVKVAAKGKSASAAKGKGIPETKGSIRLSRKA